MFKFDKTEKIIITGLAVLVSIAFICNVETLFNPKFSDAEIMIFNNVEEHDLPSDVRAMSIKYDAYKELYESDKPTIVYSYSDRTTGEAFDKLFHEKFEENFKKSKLDFNYVSFKNWKDDSLKIILKNRKSDPDAETCPMTMEEEVKLRDYLDKSKHCIINFCVVDVKRGKYSLITPNIDYIMESLNEYGNEDI